jgi:5-methylcytosine-specific restriction endonuclease McrA
MAKGWKKRRKMKRLREEQAKLRTSQQIYETYLRSGAWKKKRKEALDYYGHFCNKCKSTEYLQVHHKHYDNIFNEKIEDLEILCGDCHMQFHGIQKSDKKEKKQEITRINIENTTNYDIIINITAINKNPEICCACGSVGATEQLILKINNKKYILNYHSSCKHELHRDNVWNERIPEVRESRLPILVRK